VAGKMPVEKPVPFINEGFGRLEYADTCNPKLKKVLGYRLSPLTYSTFMKGEVR